MRRPIGRLIMPFEPAAHAAMRDLVDLAVDAAGGDAELGLVGDDADRAGLARGAVERALRAGEALDPGDVVDVDVERAADGRDRLLVEIGADRGQRARSGCRRRRSRRRACRRWSNPAATVWKLTEGSCLVYSSKFEMLSWSSRRVPIAWTLIGTFWRFSSRLVAVMMISVSSGTCAVLGDLCRRRLRGDVGGVGAGRRRLPVGLGRRRRRSWAKAGDAVSAVDASKRERQLRASCDQSSKIPRFDMLQHCVTDAAAIVNRRCGQRSELFRRRCENVAGTSG